MARETIIIEEWRVPVGETVITPTVIQQTVRRWINSLGKSPKAIARALSISPDELQRWLRNKYFIPKSIIPKFCELARNADKLPDVTAKERKRKEEPTMSKTDKTKEPTKKPPYLETLQETVLGAVDNSAGKVRAVADNARDDAALAAEVVAMKHIAAEAINSHDEVLAAGQAVAHDNMRLREELEKQRAQVNTLVERNEQLEREKNEMAETLKNNDAAQTQVEALKKEREELNVSLHEMGAELMKTRAQVEAEHKRAEEAEERAKGLTKQLSNQARVSMDIEEYRDELIDENEKLKDENKRLTDELAARNAETGTNCEELKAKVSTMQMQIDRLTAALNRVTAKYNEDCDVFRAMFLQQYRKAE